MTPLPAPTIAVLWSQFAAYHVDRCGAIAARLGARANLLAVEVAGTSETYLWERSSEVPNAAKITLFPDRSYEKIGKVQRFLAQFRALRRCRMVFVGIGYNELDVIALSLVLPLFGVRVIAMSDSKFDDATRSIWREAGKAFLLSAYSGAIVAGRRQIDYFRFLGFNRRPVLPGYDSIGVERIRAQLPEDRPAYQDRYFLYVGRFVEKKNLFALIDAYRAYARRAGPVPRRLVLAGAGPLESTLREHIRAGGLESQVDLPGFASAPEVARLLSGALALVLVSRVEQWGLVVNEAVAAGLPVIISNPVGAGDALVRNLLNGFVIEPGSTAGLTEAMRMLAEDPDLWEKMAKASLDRAWLGDAERLADAVEVLACPPADAAQRQIDALRAELSSL